MINRCDSMQQDLKHFKSVIMSLMSMILWCLWSLWSLWHTRCPGCPTCPVSFSMSFSLLTNEISPSANCQSITEKENSTDWNTKDKEMFTVRIFIIFMVALMAVHNYFGMFLVVNHLNITVMNFTDVSITLNQFK